MSAPAATFFYLGWPNARLPALPRSYCSFVQLACCRQSCTPVCLHKRGLVSVLLLVVAPGVKVLLVLAAAACAALCCCRPGVASGHWLCCTCHLLKPLAVIAPVSGKFNGKSPFPPSRITSNFALPGISRDLGISRVSGISRPAGISGIPVPREIPLF